MKADQLLEQLRHQLAAAHSTALQLADAMPIDARFEAQQVVSTLRDADAQVRDAQASLRECSA